jgi:hypothetical protein
MAAAPSGMGGTITRGIRGTALGRGGRLPLQGVQDDALSAQLVLQLGPPLRDGARVTTLDRGADLNRTLTPAQLDPEFASGLGPEDRRHGSVAEALEERNLAGEEFRTAWSRPAEAVSWSLDAIASPAASIRAGWPGTAPSDRSEAGVVAADVGRERSIAGSRAADGVPAPFPKRPPRTEASSRKAGTMGRTPCFSGVSSVPEERDAGMSAFGEAIGTASGDGMTRARFADHSAGRSVSRAVF